MKNYGQFDVPNNKKVECEFPCSCGKTIATEFPIKPDTHSDEIATCTGCGKSYDVTVMHDAGTGTVHVHSIEDQEVVKAQGLP